MYEVVRRCSVDGCKEPRPVFGERACGVLSGARQRAGRVRLKHPNLFDVVGEYYGEGDGETTFNLPDMRGHIVVATEPS